MIVRMWHGRVPRGMTKKYREFLRARAIPDYRAIPGNLGVRILQRRDGDVTHFVTMTEWTDLEAIRAFAGPHPELAKYYPEDTEFLLEFEPTVDHYDVVGSSAPGAL
jgi:heme-degrading monooxygenase HmoA